MCARQHTPPLAYGSNLKCTRRTLSGVLAKPYGRPERYWGKVESASTSTFYEDALNPSTFSLRAYATVVIFVPRSLRLVFEFFVDAIWERPTLPCTKPVPDATL